ncbi:MAG: type I restriction endonuclease subunit R [Acidaminococcus sp.]|jgi:type I restriction enzyme R subunit|nr:type I restriction endonuclease subunit R [Acidaminococcus sp.]
MATYESELSIGKHLIEQLTEKESQWTFRDDIHTVQDLWDNFRHILVRNNKEKFDEHPLTDKEFLQVQNQLRFTTFYDAAKWLMGENGIARVRIQREDASLGTIRPIVFKRVDIAGGSSVYEVVHQIEFERKDKMSCNRRGDVTLFINGLPMIHVELKNRSHPYKEAFNQIKKYLKEGVFTDIFSTLQMFVVSNGADTRYIAAASEKRLNEKFLSVWLDDNNQPINDYLSFAKEVLSIPAAHKMVSQYTVLDDERKALIMLRPYQIHAIEAIKDAVNPYSDGGRHSGYIWHTTGSGKTLTAYKAAHYLTQIPSVDKVIFVVDRRDLDNQTTGAFKAYAECDRIAVNKTDNTSDLVKKLQSKNGDVIVTTIQKLQIVMKRYPEGSKKYEKLHNLRLVFIVDECHRAVSPVAQDLLNKYFANPLWFGFTGTPIFSEDAKDSPGDLPKTTEEQYGKCLNRYTIKEALHDGSVLGFQVEYRNTFDMEELAKKNGITSWEQDEDGYDLESVLMKNKIIDAAYEDENHMLKVVDFIINKSSGKLGLDRGKGNTFTAILTTSSIKQAQRYYQLFKRVKAGKEPSVTIRDEIKRKLSDFPKVAITYSVSENNDDSSFNQDQMKEALQDYSEMFGKPYTMEQLDTYNVNVNDRLARKQDDYQVRENQLDIVIVVDRLLTGFDAPSLSTLFVDRKPMRSYSILQAFSRTNRLYDNQKRFGQIVIFQVPAHFKRAVDHAMTLYSAGGGNFVQAPSWGEAEKKFREAIQALRKVAPTPDAVDSLTKKQQIEFLKVYRDFDNAYSDLQVYSEFESKNLVRDYHINNDLIEAYGGKFVNIKEKFKGNDSNDPDINTAINYDLLCYHKDQIDEDYILKLMEAARADASALVVGQSARIQKIIKEINEEIARFRKTNPARAEILEEIWKEYQDNPALFVNQNFADIMNDRVQAKVKGIVDAFAKEWCVDPDTLAFFIGTYDVNKDPQDKQVNQDALKKASNVKEYRKTHPDIGLKYWRLLLEAVRKLYTEKLQQLIG